MVLTGTVKMLLCKLLNHETTAQSWGITNIQILDNGVKFRVCGLKYQGIVEIHLNEIEYKVNIGNNIYSTNLENLVSLLDKNIERTENYASDLFKLLDNR